MDGGASSISTSGPVLTLNLALSFTYAYAGSQAIWMEADDGTLDSGWVQRGTWTAPPLLQITSAHNGNFTQGQTGAYTVTVTNSGAGPTVGPVTVTETVPSGLTLVSMSGTDWTCPSTCARSDALAGGSSYPPITVTVNVTASAIGTITNSVSVSGGGSASNTGNDPTNIVSDFTLSLSPATAPSGTVMVGGTATYTVTVAPASGTTFSSTVALAALGLPSGFSASFSPATVAGGSGTSTMTVTTPASGAGNLTVMVNGSSGSLSHNGSAALAMQDFTATLSPGYPSAVTVAPLANATWTVVTSGLNGFSQPISLSYVSTAGENLPSCSGITNEAFSSSGYSSTSINPGQTATFVIGAGYLTQYQCFFQISASYGGTSHTMSGFMIQQGTGGFALTQPASQTVSAGSVATFQAAYTPINGFTGTVVFSIAGLPTGASLTSQSPLSSPLQGAALAVNVPAGVIGATYPITITATSGNIVNTENAQLIVQGGSTFSISTSPPQTTAPGGTAQYTVSVSGSAGLGNVILTASGGPGGATVLFNGASSASVAIGGTATMTVATSLNSGSGSYPVSITGMLGTVPKYATALTNIAQAAPASIISPVPGQISSGQSTFTWNSGIGATQYQLTVGSSAGGTNYYSASLGSAQSASVNIPSTASAAYVTLSSLTPVGWLAQSYVYGVPAALGSVMQLGAISLQPGAPPVTISSPVPSDTITGCSVPSTGVTAVIAGAAGSQTVTFTASATAQLGTTTNIACSTAALNTLALTANIETYADGITGVQTTSNGGGSYTVWISGFGFGDNDDNGASVNLYNDHGPVTYGFSWNPYDVEIDMSIPDGVCSTTLIDLDPDGSEDPDGFAPAPLSASVPLCPDVASPTPTLEIQNSRGVNITNSNQSVMVGQYLDLYAVVLNGAGTPTYQWTQPPGYTGIRWSATDDQSQGPVPISPSSLQSNELIFAWTDTSANGPCAQQGQCVRVTATVPGSPPLSAGVQFNITVPQIMPVPEQFGTSISASCPGQPLLAMCNYDPTANELNGMTFTPSSAGNNLVEWLQIVNSSNWDFFAGGSQCEKDTSGRDGGGALNFLHGPYTGDAADSPSVPLSNGFQMITISDSFSTFFMFRPTTVDLWVPLYRIDWSWSAQAQPSAASPNGWQLSSTTSGGLPPSVVPVSAGSQVGAEYPTWTQQALTTGVPCETVSAPATPSGAASGLAGTSYTYTTGGSTSSLNNPVQYQFIWGDGTASPWLTVGTASASHSWNGYGTYAVTAQARSAPNPSLLSPASSAFVVAMQ